MAVSKKELEEKITELAELLDSSAATIDQTLKENGIDLAEIKRKGVNAIKKAIPVVLEKQRQLELFLLEKRLSSINEKINQKKGEVEAGEEDDPDVN